MKEKRRRYERPRVEVVPLVTEEVVLSACKGARGSVASGKNPGRSSCTMPMACFNAGS